MMSGSREFQRGHDSIDEELEPMTSGPFFLVKTEGMITCARCYENGEFRNDVSEAVHYFVTEAYIVDEALVFEGLESKFLKSSCKVVFAILE